jgi:integrase
MNSCVAPATAEPVAATKPARRKGIAASEPAVMLEPQQHQPRDYQKWQPPAKKKRAKAADVIGPGIDVSLEMVEQMIDEGIEVRGAHKMSQLAALWANRPTLGRPMEGPRLGDRTPRTRTNGKEGRRMAVVVFRRKPITTGIVLEADEDVEKHAGAKIFLRLWKKELAKKTLGRLQARDKTMREVFREILTDLDPGDSQDPGLTGPYKRWLSDAAQLEEFLAEEIFMELPGNIAERYVLYRIQQQIKNQSVDNPNPRTVDPLTADAHVDTLFFLIRKYREKYFLPVREFKRLKFKRKPVRWLSFWQLWKLLRYARGYVLDAHGRIAGSHLLAGRYECVVRFIVIYLYGGTRKKNIHELTWGMDTHLGHIDVRAGEIQRQGPEARVTNKRRGVSDLIGSLRTLAPGWCESDLAAREALKKAGQDPGDRYVNILHDEQGYELAEGRIDTLLGEVCDAVGIKKINAHTLKHTGVTLVSRANMPLQDIEEAYSTSFITLLGTYRHLYGRWFSRTLKPFDPKDLNFLRLRRFALQDREEVYGGSAA